jgi:hypothetical protein
MTSAVLGPTIVAYHGCDIEVGLHVVQGHIPHLAPSRNPYDWLGDGIYFFEDDPLRAQRFAEAAAASSQLRLTAKPILHPFVIGAVLRTGNCLDLSRQVGIEEFSRAYTELQHGIAVDEELPMNKRAYLGDGECILHNLDRAIINYIHSERAKHGIVPYDTLRGYFRQGAPAAPTSVIAMLSHVQVVVRNTSCILGYFLPQLPMNDPFQGLNRLSASPYRKKRRAG